MNDKEKMYLQLKKENCFNNVEISKKLGVSISTICNYQKKFNLQSDFKYNYIEKLSLYEYSILIGTLLGDAWLTKSSKNSYSGGFLHKKSNLDYIKYKHNLLEKICNNIKFKKNLYGFKNSEDCYNVKFKASPLLKEINDKLYINGKKRITSFVLDHFTDISLALYYQDDGNKVKGKNKWFTYKFSMYDYTEECKNNLKQLLFNKWGIYSNVSKHCLTISAKSKKKFKTLISPYIVNSMKYKL